MKPSGNFAFPAAAVAAAVIALAGWATQAMAQGAAANKPGASAAEGGQMSGKIVWVDLKNSALLVECLDTEGCKEVKGKKGETYTLMIPEAMKSKAASWKEGGQVKISFEERAEGGRSLKSVSAR